MEFVIDGETYVIKQEDFPVPFEITNPNNPSGKPLKLNKEIVQNQGYAVYADYSSIPGNEKKEGQWRYLGYNLEGSPFTNFDFHNVDSIPLKLYTVI